MDENNENIDTILIIDDEPAHLHTLKSALEQDNLRVVFANTGEAGLERLNQLTPDLILLDIYMPGLDGFDTYKKIRERKECRDIPVIFVSASDETKDKIKALDMKAVDYVTKPFVPEVVRSRVKNQLLINTLYKKISHLESTLKEVTSDRDTLQDELDILLKTP